MAFRDNRTIFTYFKIRTLTQWWKVYTLTDIFFLLFQEAKQMENVDAYVVVFSVTDRNSFAYAHACLQDLTKKGAPSRKKVMIVVANKQDIMRNRVVSEQGLH